MTENEDSRPQICGGGMLPCSNQKGFEGTSMSDLMQVTGLQKRAGFTGIFRARRSWRSEAFDYAWHKAILSGDWKD